MSKPSSLLTSNLVSSSSLPLSSYRNRLSRPGDWHCPSCAHLNFASRNSCRQCSSPRSTASVLGIKPGLSPLRSPPSTLPNRILTMTWCYNLATLQETGSAHNATTSISLRAPIAASAPQPVRRHNNNQSRASPRGRKSKHSCFVLFPLFCICTQPDGPSRRHAALRVLLGVEIMLRDLKVRQHSVPGRKRRRNQERSQQPIATKGEGEHYESVRTRAESCVRNSPEVL